MPKTLDDMKGLSDKVLTGGKKVDGDKIVDEVLATGQYWTVIEVREKLVPKTAEGAPMIRRFRTKKILDNACHDRKVGKSRVKARLSRYYDGKRFYYGKPI